MRWRTEPEVMSGKGETICGNNICKVDKELGTWELNFRYKEGGEVKNTLVKAKCCKVCSEQLNFKVIKIECGFIHRKNTGNSTNILRKTSGKCWPNQKRRRKRSSKNEIYNKFKYVLDSSVSGSAES